jgi:ribosome-associated heat shock protein Hsp15
VSVRCDKWLHVARVFKTRTLAAKACEAGRVTVNGSVAKPHRAVDIGDRVEAEIGDWRRVLVVRGLAERPLPRAAVAGLFEDLSPPRPVRDPFERLRRRAPIARPAGAGRPTKRDRRQLARALRGEDARIE